MLECKWSSAVGDYWDWLQIGTGYNYWLVFLIEFDAPMVSVSNSPDNHESERIPFSWYTIIKSS